MEFSDFMLWKLLGLVALAFVWGIFCGVNDLELNGQRKQQGPNEAEDAAIRGPSED